MNFQECDWPPNKGELAEYLERRSRSRAAWAGFFGAIPFGLAVPILLIVVCNVRSLGWPNFKSLVPLLSCALALAPFALAIARVGQRGRLRVLAVVIPGMVVGAGSIFLGFAVGLALLPAGVLGLIFGVKAVWPCWSRADAAGLALALLGTAPTLMALILWIIERCLRGIPRGAASPLIPGLTQWGFIGFVVIGLIACDAIVSRFYSKHQ
jgi:hypothetical protein